MTSTIAEPPVEPRDAAPERRRLGFGERFSDRVNPILVREVQQAVNSKVFLLTTVVALAAIVILALAIALEQQVSAREGLRYFVMGLILLVPIVIFVIPLQAFMSMRLEVTGGTAEQLLLSNLTPASIVRGKLTAAMVQFVLYLGVFAPILALTFLLRGVDVPMITLMIVLSCLACLCATSVAIALGALCRWRQAQSVSLAIAGFALGGTSIGLMAGMWDLTREISREILMSGPFLWTIGVVLSCGGFGLLACSMVAASTLTHPYENRSTPFRLLGLAAIVVAFLWVLTNPWGLHHEAAAACAISLAAALTPFVVFAVTEEDALSPRVRTLVPRRRWAALLSLPLMPGGARGLAFTLLAALLTLGIALAITVVTGHGIRQEMIVAGTVWAYIVLYAAAGCHVRRWLRPGITSTWIARCLVPALVGIGSLVPVIWDLIVQGGVRHWHYGHVLDPLFTIDVNWRRLGEPAIVVAVLASVLVLPALPRMIAAKDELMDAAESRRRHAA